MWLTSQSHIRQPTPEPSFPRHYHHYHQYHHIQLDIADSKQPLSPFLKLVLVRTASRRRPNLTRCPSSTPEKCFCGEASPSPPPTLSTSPAYPTSMPPPLPPPPSAIPSKCQQATSPHVQKQKTMPTSSFSSSAHAMSLPNANSSSGSTVALAAPLLTGQ